MAAFGYVVRAIFAPRALTGADLRGFVAEAGGLDMEAGGDDSPVPVAGGPPTTQADFAGIPFFTSHGEINGMAVEALGATHVDTSAPERNAQIEVGEIRAYETRWPSSTTRSAGPRSTTRPTSTSGLP